MPTADVPPPVGSGDTPQLFRLGGLRFQALCRDLLDVSDPSTIQQCVEFGINGEAQYGIDLLANLASEGIDVAQCKAEQNFTPKKIRNASDEFLKNWDYWKEKGVRRFLVLVGSEVSQRERQEEIAKQRTRFRHIGIDYQLWPAPTIVNKLRPHRGIVTQHLDAAWADRICGPAAEASSPVALAAQMALNERLSVVAGSATDERLGRIKQLWQSGQRSEAWKFLKAIRDDLPVWTALPNPIKGNVLRFEAAISLDSGISASRVITLLNDAAQLNPSTDDRRIRAALSWREGDHLGAITILDTAKTEAELNLKAMMLLASGRVDEAEVAITKPAANDFTAEHWRIASLCHFARGHLAEARLSIQKAEEEASDSLAVNLTAGAIEYFSAIVPSKLPTAIPAWPEPLPWAFILRSDEALGRLNRAAGRFKKALGLSDLSAEERHSIEAWYIACLANLPDREDIAGAELETLLRRDEVNHRLIVWATARFPSLTIDKHVLALRNAVVDQPGTCEQVVALAYRYAATRKWKKAFNLLTAKRSLFSDANTKAVWSFWVAQLKIAMNQLNDADQKWLIQDLPDRERRILEAKLLDREKTPQGRSTFVEHLEGSYRATNDPQFLLEALEMKAQQGDWSYVAERAEALSAVLPTAEILTFCITGAFRACRFQVCMKLLATNIAAFPGAKLPADLRRIRVHCQRALGFTSEAIREAEALASETPSLENLYGLSQLYFSIGDYRHQAITAERIASCENVGAQMLLRLSWQLQWESRDLATKLWKQAIDAGTADDDVIPALELGYALGLDDQLKGLTERMVRFGVEGKAGVQVASLEDIKRFATEFHDRAQKLGEAYDRSQVPIHMIASLLNVTLAEIYHKQLSESAESQFTCWQPSVWARHGSRPIPPVEPQSAIHKSLTIDVTSVLLAQHFSYLDVIETAFRPIRISPGLIPSLILMQDRLTTNQPQRIQACTKLKNSVEAGLITTIELERSEFAGANYPSSEWLALADKAISAGGFIIDFLPLLGEDGNPVPLDSVPERILTHLIGPRAILRALFEHGPLSESEYLALVERLGSVAINAGQVIPRPGDALYFAGTCIETLAGIDVLSILTQRFGVYVTSREVRHFENTLISAQMRTGTATWVKDLINRISGGIRKATYELLPEVVDGQGASADIQSENADLAALLPILKSVAEDGERFCADDRWINGHARVGQMESTDSVEVLAALTRSEQITRERFFELIGKMRSAGVHFIPLSSNEIIHTLDGARVFDFKVVETQGLINLRRGVAASVLHSRVLQRPPANYAGAEFRELGLLIQHVRACIESLCLLWNDQTLSAEDREAKAQWIMEALYVDQHALRRLAELPANVADDRYALALTFASVLARAVTTFSPKDRDWKGREFIEWVFARLIRRRIEFDPSLLETTSEYVKNLLRDLVPQDLTRRASKAMILIMQNLVRNLPRELRAQIGRDSDFMALIGLKTITVAQLGNLHFEKGDFTSAVAEAVNGNIGTATVLNSDVRVTFSMLGSATSIIQASLPTGECYTMSDPVLGLLTNSALEREKVAKGLQRVLDLRPSQVSATVAELVTTDDVELRLGKAEELRAKSFVSFYDNLEARLRTGAQITETDLFPMEPVSIFSYLRLSPDGTYAEQIKSFLEEELPQQPSVAELITVLTRLFSLPCPLAESMKSALSTLNRTQRRQLIKMLLRLRRTPLQQFHLAHVLIEVFGPVDPVFLRMGIRMLRRLLSEYSCFKPYIACIRWSLSRVKNSNRSENWGGDQQLAAAWVHGDHIFGILRANGYDVSQVADRLELSPARLQNVFSAPHYSSDDVAHPDNVEPEALLLCGLNYVLGNADCEDSDIRTRVFDAVTVTSGEQTFPVLGLIPSTETASDRLFSFFSTNRLALLHRWMSADSYACMMNALNGFRDEQIIAALQEGICDMWMSLSAVVGQFPLRSELVSEIEKAIVACDFRKRATDDPRIACTTLLIATSLLKFVPADFVAAHLEEQLVGVASKVGVRENPDETRRMGFSLIESAINIARTNTLLSNRVKKFAVLIARAAAAWPGLTEIIRPYVQRLCEELPLVENTELWRLNCQLRTKK